MYCSKTERIRHRDFNQHPTHLNTLQKEKKVSYISTVSRGSLKYISFVEYCQLSGLQFNIIFNFLILK